MPPSCSFPSTILSSICTPVPWDHFFKQTTSLVAQTVKHLPTMWEIQVQSLGWEDPLEKEMATHSSILAWKIPWMEEPGGLQTMGLQRVGHNWATSLLLFTSLKPLSQFLVLGEPRQRPEKAMAPHSSTLAWKVTWTEEPGGLQSMGSRRVGHDWATSLSLFTFMHWRRKWQPTPVFLPRESQGWWSLVGCRLWGCTESDMTEVT